MSEEELTYEIKNLQSKLKNEKVVLTWSWPSECKRINVKRMWIENDKGFDIYFDEWTEQRYIYDPVATDGGILTFLITPYKDKELLVCSSKEVSIPINPHQITYSIQRQNYFFSPYSKIYIVFNEYYSLKHTDVYYTCSGSDVRYSFLEPLSHRNGPIIVKKGEIVTPHAFVPEQFKIITI